MKRIISRYFLYMHRALFTFSAHMFSCKPPCVCVSRYVSGTGFCYECETNTFKLKSICLQNRMETVNNKPNS